MGERRGKRRRAGKRRTGKKVAAADQVPLWRSLGDGFLPLPPAKLILGGRECRLSPSRGSTRL